MPNPAAKARAAEIDYLESALAEARQEIERLQRQKTGLIPVEAVHEWLDALNLPRRGPSGSPLFLTERFALMRARMELESG
jgi:hypothetical protein